MKKVLLLSLSLLVYLALAACNPAKPTPVPPTATPAPTATVEPEVEIQDIVDTLNSSENLTALAKAIESADLVEKLRSDGPFTLFAPVDEAFAALPAGTLDDADALVDILLLHIVAGELTSAELAQTDTLTSLLGDALPIVQNGESFQVNGAKVIAADGLATNGVIHTIDAVLIPDDVE